MKRLFFIAKNPEGREFNFEFKHDYDTDYKVFLENEDGDMLTFVLSLNTYERGRYKIRQVDKDKIGFPKWIIALESEFEKFINENLQNNNN